MLEGELPSLKHLLPKIGKRFWFHTFSDDQVLAQKDDATRNMMLLHNVDHRTLGNFMQTSQLAESIQGMDMSDIAKDVLEWTKHVKESNAALPKTLREDHQDI